MKEWKQSGERIIGYVGQLIRRKASTPLRAFSELPFTNRRLCIVGEAERADWRSGRAARRGERVRFLGYRADRIALLRGSTRSCCLRHSKAHHAAFSKPWRSVSSHCDGFRAAERDQAEPRACCSSVRCSRLSEALASCSGSKDGGVGASSQGYVTRSFRPK